MNNPILPSPKQADSWLYFPMLFHGDKFNRDKANEPLCFVPEKRQRMHCLRVFFVCVRQWENGFKLFILSSCLCVFELFCNQLLQRGLGQVWITFKSDVAEEAAEEKREKKANYHPDLYALSVANWDTGQICKSAGRGWRGGRVGIIWPTDAQRGTTYTSRRWQYVTYIFIIKAIRQTGFAPYALNILVKGTCSKYTVYWKHMQTCMQFWRFTFKD